MKYHNLDPERTRVDELIQLFTDFKDAPNKFKDKNIEAEEKYTEDRVSVETLKKFNTILNTNFGSCSGGLYQIDAQIWLYKQLEEADDAKVFCEAIGKDLSDHSNDYVENSLEDLSSYLDTTYIDNLMVEEEKSPTLIEDEDNDDEVLLEDRDDRNSTPIGDDDIVNKSEINFKSSQTSPKGPNEYEFSVRSFDNITSDLFNDTDIDDDKKNELVAIFKDKSQLNVKDDKGTLLDEKYYHHSFDDKGKQITNDEKKSDQALDQVLAERLQALENEGPKNTFKK